MDMGIDIYELCFIVLVVFILGVMMGQLINR